MEYAIGPIFMRECDGPMKAGEVVQLHSHNFDHVTRVVAGSYKIERFRPLCDADGKTRFDENQQPMLVKEMEVDVRSGLRAVVLVPAYAWHRLTALEDNSIYVCEFTHRDHTGEITQRYDGFIRGHT